MATRSKPSEEFENFRKLASKALAVSKAEIDKRERLWKQGKVSGQKRED